MVYKTLGIVLTCWNGVCLLSQYIFQSLGSVSTNAYFAITVGKFGSCLRFANHVPVLAANVVRCLTTRVCCQFPFQRQLLRTTARVRLGQTLEQNWAFADLIVMSCGTLASPTEFLTYWLIRVVINRGCLRDNPLILVQGNRCNSIVSFTLKVSRSVRISGHISDQARWSSPSISIWVHQSSSWLPSLMRNLVTWCYCITPDYLWWVSIIDDNQCSCRRSLHASLRAAIVIDYKLVSCRMAGYRIHIIGLNTFVTHRVLAQRLLVFGWCRVVVSRIVVFRFFMIHLAHFLHSCSTNR